MPLSPDPTDSVISRVIADLREWHVAEPDWRRTREKIGRWLRPLRRQLPHGAQPRLMVVAPYGDDDFGRRSRSSIRRAGTPTATPATSARPGRQNGHAGIDGSGYDWRGPVADRLYLPTAEGGQSPTPCARATRSSTSPGRCAGSSRLDRRKTPVPLRAAPDQSRGSGLIWLAGSVSVWNVLGHSATGTRSLAIQVADLATGGCAPSHDTDLRPRYRPGIFGRTTSSAARRSTQAKWSKRGSSGCGECRPDPCRTRAAPREWRCMGRLLPTDRRRVDRARWRRNARMGPIPDLGGQPILDIGFRRGGSDGAGICLYLDRLGWGGPPNVRLEAVRSTAGNACNVRGWTPWITSMPRSPETYPDHAGPRDRPADAGDRRVARHDRRGPRPAST